MIGVIDTSALIRLFVPDGPAPTGLESFFRKVEQGVHLALAPELLVAELTNVLLKKIRMGELTETEGEELLQDLLAMPIRLLPHAAFMENALEVALQNSLTVYDALYLAVANQQNASIFSSDEQMVKVAKSLQLQIGS